MAGVFLGLAQIPRMPRRMKGILVSAGLVWCSAIAVHFSGGVIEAHFHFFVVLGFIALYQDWAAFGWAIVFTALSHGVGSQLAPDLMYNHEAAIQRPWTWALIHAGMVLFAAVGQVMGWRHAERAQDRATELTTQLVREQAERQASNSRLYVNLARRTQSLLHRQLSLIDELEEREEDPDTLEKLFALDHLATRVRRNAESLLVMAGQNSPRHLDGAVPLADVARAAASEVEQYQRIEVRVDAEYSRPTTPVTASARHDGRGAIVTIEDHGIGLSDEELARANATLRDPPELDEEVVRHLGFQVVGRLARKLALRVQLRPTSGGGITAVVELPPALLVTPSEQDHTSDVEAPALAVGAAANAAPVAPPAPAVTDASPALAPPASPAPAPPPAPVDDSSLYPALAVSGPPSPPSNGHPGGSDGHPSTSNGHPSTSNGGSSAAPTARTAWTSTSPPSATNDDIDPLFDHYFDPPAPTTASAGPPTETPPAPSPPEARQALSAFQAGGRAARDRLVSEQGEPRP